MIIVHALGESHADWFGGRASELIDFGVPAGTAAGAYHAADDRLIADLACGLEPAADALRDLEPVRGEADWPDLLASDMRNDAVVSLGAWAEQHGLRRETISRGFLRAYGVSPAVYRVGVRVKSVVRALREGDASLAAVAADHGFFDQSHMSRAVLAATGLTPARLRKVKFVQDRSTAPA